MNNPTWCSRTLVTNTACPRGNRLLSVVPSLLCRLLLLLAVLCGCQQSVGNDLESLRAEVMAIHDEAMAKMGEMHEREVELRLRADELKAAGQEAEAELKAADRLQQAQQAMMEWMHQYKQPDRQGERQQIEAYLLAQKEKIINVRELITTTLQEAAAPRPAR